MDLVKLAKVDMLLIFQRLKNTASPKVIYKTLTIEFLRKKKKKKKKKEFLRILELYFCWWAVNKL